jgi:hypothetical protein
LARNAQFTAFLTKFLPSPAYCLIRGKICISFAIGHTLLPGIQYICYSQKNG